MSGAGSTVLRPKIAAVERRRATRPQVCGCARQGRKAKAGNKVVAPFGAPPPRSLKRGPRGNDATAAMVARGIDPARESDVLPDVFRAQFVAVMGALHGDGQQSGSAFSPQRFAALKGRGFWREARWFQRKNPPG